MSLQTFYFWGLGWVCCPNRRAGRRTPRAGPLPGCCRPRASEPSARPPLELIIIMPSSSVLFLLSAAFKTVGAVVHAVGASVYRSVVRPSANHTEPTHPTKPRRAATAPKPFPSPATPSTPSTARRSSIALPPSSPDSSTLSRTASTSSLASAASEALTDLCESARADSFEPDTPYGPKYNINLISQLGDVTELPTRTAIVDLASLAVHPRLRKVNREPALCGLSVTRSSTLLFCGYSLAEIEELQEDQVTIVDAPIVSIITEQPPSPSVDVTRWRMDEVCKLWEASLVLEQPIRSMIKSRHFSRRQRPCRA